MKKRSKDNTKDSTQEKILKKALRTGGFLFPETIEEVKEFERLYGTTDVVLPPDLQEPPFLDTRGGNNNRKIKISAPASDFAMAAREASNELPSEIQEKIIADIKSANAKKKKK